jgi:hypothetical protein
VTEKRVGRMEGVSEKTERDRENSKDRECMTRVTGRPGRTERAGGQGEQGGQLVSGN